MQKILFVCLGNICRSPLAEGIMLHLNKRDNLDLEIDSAGLIGDHAGQAPDPRTVANAKKHGIDLSSLRARQLTSQDFHRFDQVLVMDASNRRMALHLNVDEQNKVKLKLLLSYLPEGEMKEVPDPYYGTDKDFENVFQLIHAACEALSTSLKASGV